MLTMQPLPCRSMIAPAAWQQMNVPVRFTPIIRFHSSRPSSSAGLGMLIPALFTNTSSAPDVWSARSHSACTCCGSVMSQPAATAEPPRCQ